MSETNKVRGYAKIENHILRCNKLGNVEYRLLMIMLSWSRGNVYNPFNISYQQLAAAMGYKPLKQPRVDGKPKYDTSRVRQTVSRLVKLGAIRKAVVVNNADAPLLPKPKGNPHANQYMLVPDFFETGEEGLDEPACDESDRVGATLEVGSGRPYRQGQGDPTWDRTVGSGRPSRIFEKQMRITTTNNVHAFGVVGSSGDHSLKLEQDGPSAQQRITQTDPASRTTKDKPVIKTKSVLPKTTTKSRVDSGPAKLAYAIWRTCNLPVGNKTVTLLSINQAAYDLHQELGPDDFEEICTLAFNNRAAANWGPTASSCLTLDWMFKTKKSEDAPNIIKAASGSMNWTSHHTSKTGTGTKNPDKPTTAPAATDETEYKPVSLEDLQRQIEESANNE